MSAKRKKDDHLAPTPDHQHKDAKDIKANLSDAELQDRLDLYSKVGNEKEPFFSIQQIKKHYLKQARERQAHRGKMGVHYGQGQLAGLPQEHFDNIKDQNEQQEQKLRNDVTKQAKEQYRENNSLEKSFKEKEGNDNTFKKEFDKSRDNLNSELYHRKVRRDFDTSKGKEMDMD